MNQTELLHVNFPHLRDLKPFDTAHSATPWLADSDAKHSRKLCASIEEAVNRCGLQDGMTISFHHAFREGDRVINTVVALLARMGFKNLTLASSSLMTCNDALIEHIESGVITRIYPSGMRGRLAGILGNGTSSSVSSTTLRATCASTLASPSAPQHDLPCVPLALPTASLHGTPRNATSIFSSPSWSSFTRPPWE